MTSTNATNLAAQCQATPATPEQLATWVKLDEQDADEDGRTSMHWLMGFIYGDYEWCPGESSHADEQLTAAGLLAPQVDRTSNCRTWQTDLGRKVAALFGWSS